MPGWHDAELALTALAAMFSPTTLTFSVLILVLSKRPLRSGFWFYLGALGVTVAVGVIAAFVIGDAAAPAKPSDPPKTWVAVILLRPWTGWVSPVSSDANWGARGDCGLAVDALPVA